MPVYLIFPGYGSEALERKISKKFENDLSIYCFSDELIILSACGTAAIVNMRMEQERHLELLTKSLDRSHFEKEKDSSSSSGKERRLHVDVNLANQAATHRLQHMHRADR